MPSKKQANEPTQRIAKDYEIPVPKRKDFFDALGKGAKTPKREGSAPGKRRTSRDP